MVFTFLIETVNLKKTNILKILCRKVQLYYLLYLTKLILSLNNLDTVLQHNSTMKGFLPSNKQEVKAALSHSLQIQMATVLSAVFLVFVLFLFFY